MLLENAQFGGYKLKSLIGKGGVAEVWLADQLALDREVALKVLPAELVGSEDVEFVERFKREAQAIGHLDHPGILPVFDYGQAEGYLYLVMPYARGGNLRSRVRKGVLTKAEVIPIFENILGGAAHAHSQGVIHRDLKPANILLHEDGRAYIGDFGIAKTMDNSTTLTQAGLIMGSPSYMAPEQFMGRADYRSDIYSLGLILFFMLTGRKLYAGRLPFEIGNRHLNDPIPLPDPQVPPEFEPFLLKALAKKPEDRFQNVQEMLKAFKAISLVKAPLISQTQDSMPVERPTMPTPIISDEARWHREKSAGPAVPPTTPSSNEARWHQEKGAVPAANPQEARWHQEKQAVPIPPPLPDQAREKQGQAAPPLPGQISDPNYARYSQEKAYQAPQVPGTPYPPPPGPGPQRTAPPLPDEARWRQEKGGPTQGAVPGPGFNQQAYRADYNTPVQGYVPGQTLPVPPVKRKRKLSAWLLVAIGVLVIAIAAVGVTLFLNNNRTPATPVASQSTTTASASTATDTPAAVVSTAAAGTINNPATPPPTTQPNLRTIAPVTTPPVQSASPGTAPVVQPSSPPVTTGATVNGTPATPPGTSPATNNPGTVLLSGHAGPVNSIAWSADGRFFLSASDDKTLKIWDAATNKEVKTLDDKAKPNTDRVLSAVFSKDGQFVVASLADKSVHIYSVKDGTLLASPKGDLTAPAGISADQALVPYVGARTLRTWNISKKSAGLEFPYFDAKVAGLAPTALAFSPDNTTLALGLNNGRIIFYKVENGQPLMVVEPAANVKNGVRLLAWSAGGNRLAVGREKSFETLSVDLKNKLALPTAVSQSLAAPASGLSISQDGKRLAVSSQNGELQIWSLENNQMVSRFKITANPVIGLNWSQDNRQITVATGGNSPALNTYPSQPTERNLTVAINPQNGTRVTGNGLLTEIPGGSVRVTLNVEGLEPGQHKVHIHAGTCTNQGDIKYDLENLRTAADGKATATTVIKADFTALTTGSFYINVHNDPGTDTYIASCGEIHV